MSAICLSHLIHKTTSISTSILKPTTNKILKRTMSTAKTHDSIPHEDRTAAEPRQNVVEPVTISSIRDINSTTRVLRLTPEDPTHTIKVGLP